MIRVPKNFSSAHFRPKKSEVFQKLDAEILQPVSWLRSCYWHILEEKEKKRKPEKISTRIIRVGV